MERNKERRSLFTFGVCVVKEEKELVGNVLTKRGEECAALFRLGVTPSLFHFACVFWRRFTRGGIVSSLFLVECGA